MYTYELDKKDGYYILNNGKKIMHQFEPHIPFRGETVEQSAQNHIGAIEAENEYNRQYEKSMEKKIAEHDVQITNIELAMAEAYENKNGGVK